MPAQRWLRFASGMHQGLGHGQSSWSAFGPPSSQAVPAATIRRLSCHTCGVRRRRGGTYLLLNSPFQAAYAAAWPVPAPCAGPALGGTVSIGPLVDQPPRASASVQCLPPDYVPLRMCIFSGDQPFASTSRARGAPLARLRPSQCPLPLFADRVATPVACGGSVAGLTF